jgi:hypothetical protein
MNKTFSHKIRLTYALLLTTVLIGSLLVKPLHILLVHHDLAETVHAYSNQKIISNLHHHECAICDFEFCSFIPQKQVIVPQVNIIPTNELVYRMVACFVCNSSHNFQLRAPPAC